MDCAAVRKLSGNTTLIYNCWFQKIQAESFLLCSRHFFNSLSSNQQQDSFYLSILIVVFIFIVFLIIIVVIIVVQVIIIIIVLLVEVLIVEEIVIQFVKFQLVGPSIGQSLLLR